MGLDPLTGGLLVGGLGLASGVAGSIPTTQKFSNQSKLDLAAPGSLEELLAGKQGTETFQTPEQLAKIKNLEAQLASARRIGESPAGIERLTLALAEARNAPGAGSRATSQPGFIENQFKGIQDLLAKGPGSREVTRGFRAQNELEDMLQGLISSGGLPTNRDIQAAQGIAQQLSAPQAEQLRQLFQQQEVTAGRQAQRLGRTQSDPVLRNLLARSQGDQQALLGAQQQANAQQIALGLPGQRLGFATQRANLLSGLGSQALQNQLSVLGLGQELLGKQQQFRIGTAGQLSTGSQSSGGGLGGAISGALGGIGSGLSAVSSFNTSNNLNNLLQAQTASFQQPAQGSFLGGSTFTPQSIPGAGIFGGGNPFAQVQQSFASPAAFGGGVGGLGGGANIPLSIFSRQLPF